MDIIDLLSARKAAILASSGEIRKKISDIVDEDSFVELGAFAFSGERYDDEKADGLGVVTGYATIDDYPVYVVAENGKVNKGGLTKANLQKMTACVKKAINASTPVVYLLDCEGTVVSEGIETLEGMASFIAAAQELKDVAPQFVIATGNVYGSLAILASEADYTFVQGGACISYASPAVISASVKSGVSKEKIGGNKSENGVCTFAVKELTEARNGIVKILGVLPEYSGAVLDCEDDMNRSAPALNKKCDAKSVIEATFDKNSFIELCKGYSNAVITGIGRIGGISSAAIVFDGGKDGVSLTINEALKIKNFANYCSANALPVVTFVNSNGIKADAFVAESPVMAEISNMLYALSSTARISVVYGKAVGFGYTAFASKEFGNAYTYAFANAKISLLDGVIGAAATNGTVDGAKLKDLSEEYDEENNAFNAAKLGAADNVIEPQFVRQYVISALQTIV